MTHLPAASAVRSDDANDQPATRRGRASRRQLLQSARAVFEDRGYLDARVSDIVAAAGMGQGSFYTYWSSKDEIFTELVRQLQDDQQNSVNLPKDINDPVERVAEANRRFVRKYQENAAFIATWEQVCTINADFRAIRLELRARTAKRLAADIRRMQLRGEADPLLDPMCTARALISMVTHFVYMWLAMGEQEDEERVIETLTRLWVNAIGLKTHQTPIDTSERTPHV